MLRRIELHAIRVILTHSRARPTRFKMLEFADLLCSISVGTEIAAYWRAFTGVNLNSDESLVRIQLAFAGLTQIAVEATLAELRGG